MITVPARADMIASLLAPMPAARRAGFTADGIAADLAASVVTYAGVDATGAVITMGGVMPAGTPDTGYVWQIITDVRHHKRAYLRQGRLMQARFHALYPRLVVAIELDNAAAQRHARRLGWHALAPLTWQGRDARIYERVCDE